MTTTISNGRLCNQIIRNLATSLIAEKNDLYVNYVNFNVIDSVLGITLYIGRNKHDTTQELTDNNYLEILNSDSKIKSNLNPNNNYFQTQEVTDILVRRLRSEPVMQRIIEKNPYGSRYQNNNDLLIHVRLGDVCCHNPGLEYYLKAIDMVGDFDILHIATDSINHPIISQIGSKFPKEKTKAIFEKEAKTIQLGSTCKHIILSHGTFSVIIGYLAFYADNVYYPDYEPVWCPLGMFQNKGWIGVKKDDSN